MSDVKWFSNAMRGAPTLSGDIGTLISVLDACLVTGFGAVTPTGITISGGIATVALPPNQSFLPQTVVLVSGATPAALNGEQRVLTSSSTQITFATTAADGAASGTIEIRVAPAGWQKVYSGTNKAVYRSTDAAGPRHYLRVQDTTYSQARVIGYVSMTDVDTGEGPFPTEAQFSGGGYWLKSTSSGSTATGWKIVTDPHMILYAAAPQQHQDAIFTATALRGFGWTVPLRAAGDQWATVLSFSGNTTPQNYGNLDGGNASSSQGMSVMPRAWHGLGSSVIATATPTTGGALVSGNDGAMGPAPSEIDGEIKLARVFLREGTASEKPPRSIAPGVLHVPQSGLLSVVNDGAIVDGAGEFAGRKLLTVAAGSVLSAPPSGAYFIDITGPWR